MLPVDVVLHPSWWFHHEAITFDEDFFFHPARCVEVERKMERALFERWGRFGLGRQHAEDRPVVGAVHLAAGWLISEMLGCRVEYLEDSPPRVVAANVESLEVSPEAAFAGGAYRRFARPGRLASHPVRPRRGGRQLGEACSTRRSICAVSDS